MRSKRVVESFQISKDIGLRRSARVAVFRMNQLALQTTEEILGNGIVVRITLAGHAMPNPIRIQPLAISTGRILNPSMTVKIKPLGGFRWHTAISKADGVKRVSISP